MRCNVAATPSIKQWSLVCFSLDIGQPCDLLWSTICVRAGPVPGLSIRKSCRLLLAPAQLMDVKAQTGLLAMGDTCPIGMQKGVGHPLGSLMGEQGEEAENLGLEMKDQVNWK